VGAQWGRQVLQPFLHAFYDGAAFFPRTAKFHGEVGLSADQKFSRAMGQGQTINGTTPVVKSNHRGSHLRMAGQKYADHAVFINYGNNERM